MSPMVREFHVQLDELELVRQWMLEGFQQQDRPDVAARHEVLVAVTEVFVNFTKHSKLTAQDTIEIQLEFRDDLLVIVFKDAGESFDLDELEAQDLDALHESGYGLFIVKSLMDTFEYYPKASGKAYNITKMTKGYQHGQR